MGEASPLLERQDGASWTVMGGYYNPNDQDTLPATEQLDQIWDKVHLYTDNPTGRHEDSARERFWALGILGYAFDLCHPGMAANTAAKEAVNHDLSKAFAEAIHDESVNPGIWIINKDQENKIPLLEASDAILAADRRIAQNPAMSGRIRNVIGRTIQWRYDLEQRRVADQT